MGEYSGGCWFDSLLKLGYISGIRTVMSEAQLIDGCSGSSIPDIACGVAISV